MTDGQFSDTATVTVNVEPVIRPRARDDKYTVLEDSGANVLDQPQGVLANDLFNDGFTHSLFVIITPPAHGTADIVGENIVYTPAPDFFGTDTLVYQIDDDFVDQSENPSVPSTALVTITVTPVNDAPDGQRRHVLGDPGRQLEQPAGRAGQRLDLAGCRRDADDHQGRVESRW